MRKIFYGGISVIIPVYNSENYIDFCIESIINQSYKNLEIILIDDGSTDGSGKICDSYAEKDKRIKVVHQINGGVSAARNKGITSATRPFIAFGDSDDVIRYDMFENMLRMLVKLNTDCVCCNIEIINYDGSHKILRCPTEYGVRYSKGRIEEDILKPLLSFSEKKQMDLVQYGTNYIQRK